MIIDKIGEDFYYHLLNGTMNDAYNYFGAHVVRNSEQEIIGCEFLLFAPNAKYVAIVGQFNFYDKGANPMRLLDKGVYYAYFDGNIELERYKYCIVTKQDKELMKADPYAFYSDLRPENNSKIYDIEGYKWNDAKYLKKQKQVYDKPFLIYEMHLGSWRRNADNNFCSYRDIAPQLIEYLLQQGYTHVEFLPLYEHPLDDSWGYMGTGYYSATARFGVPKDLMYLIDGLHKNNIGVIMDWVPGHICRDDFGLYMFDGTSLYEYDERSLRENDVWGTSNLDLSKGVTRSFLISNAIFWLKYFHIDGFRVDAVSNIIYHHGNSSHGTNEGACDFLRTLSIEVFKYNPDAILAAEDSSAHPGVTHPAEIGGLGFNYKWNMGWMNDTLRYFKLDPVYRKYHHNLITFGFTYIYDEQFILALSHDEVVHLKASILNKMPGDYWQKFANYRLLMGLMMTHPGKKLLFMGDEFAHYNEWDFKSQLDWELYGFPAHDSANLFVREMMNLYKTERALYTSDHTRNGFDFIEADNSDQSMYIFVRFSDNFDEHLVIILNATPVCYQDYKIGVPGDRDYYELINSDYEKFGGSGQYNGINLTVRPEPLHRQNGHISVTIPPLGIIVLKMIPPKKIVKKSVKTKSETAKKTTTPKVKKIEKEVK